MSEVLKKKCDDGIQMLEYLKDTLPSYGRIVAVVQNHPEMFGAMAGQHCGELAAKYLEQRAAEWRSIN